MYFLLIKVVYKDESESRGRFWSCVCKGRTPWCNDDGGGDCEFSMVLPFGGTSLMFTMQLVRMRMKVIPRSSSGSSTKPALHLETWSCVRGGHLQIFWTLYTYTLYTGANMFTMSPHFDLLLRIGKGFWTFLFPPLWKALFFQSCLDSFPPLCAQGFPPESARISHLADIVFTSQTKLTVSNSIIGGLIQIDKIPNLCQKSKSDTK